MIRVEVFIKLLFCRRGEDKWRHSFYAPKQPGKYTLEAFSMDANGKLDVAKTVSIEVKQKVSLKVFSTSLKNVITEKMLSSVKI